MDIENDLPQKANRSKPNTRRYARRTRKTYMSNKDKMRWFLAISGVILFFVSLLISYATKNPAFVSTGSPIALLIMAISTFGK